MRQRVVIVLALLTSLLLMPAPAPARDTPRSGGELIFVVAAEPPSFDGHQEETFAMLHPGAPQYNTLMRVDPTDKTGTKFVGDLAESWTISPDRRTYTFKLRQGVKFHDGSVMTSKDVKASYDHIIFPPANVVSSRKATYSSVESVEAPTPDTVVFRLKFAEASFMAGVNVYHCCVSPPNEKCGAKKYGWLKSSRKPRSSDDQRACAPARRASPRKFTWWYSASTRAFSSVPYPTPKLTR
jgi:ABC-type transport system substrate-binding protein